MPQRLTVSVVVPHLNQHAALHRCLHSLNAQTFPAAQTEIIVADNGSRESVHAVLGTCPSVRLVHEARPGPGMARNAGVSAATGDVLAFIDADCRAHPQWLEAAVRALSRPQSSGVVGGDVRIDLADPKCLTGLEAYESVFAYRQALYIRRMHFSGTGNLAMRRCIYDRVGPFAGIGVAEDRDWGRRAVQQGIRTHYAPHMIVYHPARIDLEDMAAKWRRQTAHDLEDHRARGGGDLKWLARTAGVLGVTPLHALKILLSNRVPDLPSRLRGIRTLIAIRRLRVREMLTQFRQPDHIGAAGWNRGE